ncbi:MAG: SHOCT domain-containing protein [Patescibacteria group bacterium]
MMGNYYFGHMLGWGIFGDILMMLIWTGIIFFVIWITIEATGKLTTHPSTSALEVLKKRYAKGEISKEEFETKKKDLIN